MTLSHTDDQGRAHMVDVSSKAPTVREARAQAHIAMRAETVALIRANNLKKGDVLAVARVAGIQAAKRCSDLIPLCHPLALSKVSIDFELADDKVMISSFCKLTGQTGVEMEALTAASVAALTVYDMCKAVDKDMAIEQVCLLEKIGGQSGHYQRGGDQ